MRYSRDYLQLAARTGAGFVLETPAWRANHDWGAELGYTPNDLRRVNADGVGLAHQLRGEWTGDGPVLVSGCLGPRGDGYVPGTTMSPDRAAEYHRPQVAALAEAGADLVTSFTLSYVDEAIGVVAAAADVGVPVVAGFTVETDGRLPSGDSLAEAVRAVDASTGSYASWFMVNCAHPSHVRQALTGDPSWMTRIGALRANASRLSHAELDEAAELDAGDPVQLGADYAGLAELLPELHVLGGCCGTDIRHVTAIAEAWRPRAGSV
jgi:S-methylmethionine-dependent homocysteine/selenocysteine methylase